jgi:hypothetical protein
MVEMYNASVKLSSKQLLLEDCGDCGDAEEAEELMTQTTTGTMLTKDCLIVDVSELHWGAKERNPVADVRFFSRNAEKIVANDVVQAHMLPEGKYSGSLPRVFCERVVRVFCRYPQTQQAAEHAFKLWTRARDAPSPFLGASQPNSQM